MPMFAALAASFALVSTARSANNSQSAQRWAHELVVLDEADEFYAGGRSTGARCAFTVEQPLILEAGPAGSRALEHAPGLSRTDLGPFDTPVERGWFVSAPIEPREGFQQLLLSWNIDTSPGACVAVELSVRDDVKSPWSEWMYVGDWGDTELWRRTRDMESGALVGEHGGRVVAIAGAQIDVDFFTSEHSWTQARFRVRTSWAGAEPARRIVVRRVALCFSRRTDGPAPSFVLPAEAIRRLDVPFRSQRTERPEVAGRICSPTSVAMALAYRGLEVETLAAAERIYDAAHDIYGNWTRAIQGAYSFGAPGYLARFSDWNEVARHIAGGTPLVISIAAKPGELDGAPYPRTDGHLAVLCGFDEKGDVHVNDPAASTPETGRLVYRRDQLERVWMARGGTSYVILAPRTD